MSTRAPARPSRAAGRGDAIGITTCTLGGLLLAGEAAVHLQQYASLFHALPLIGPLFLANATACVAAIVGLAYPRTRALAALAGVVISAAALASLVVSYGRGLFGWQEAGFRTAVALAVITELGAVILLAAALATRTVPGHARVGNQDRREGP